MQYTYVYLYTFAYISIYICIHIYVYIDIYLHLHIHVHMCIYICICMYIYIDIYIYTHPHTHTNTHIIHIFPWYISCHETYIMYIHIHLYMYVRLCTLYVHVHLHPYTHTYTHIYTRTHTHPHEHTHNFYIPMIHLVTWNVHHEYTSMRICIYVPVYMCTHHQAHVFCAYHNRLRICSVLWELCVDTEYMCVMPYQAHLTLCPSDTCTLCLHRGIRHMYSVSTQRLSGPSDSLPIRHMYSV